MGLFDFFKTRAKNKSDDKVEFSELQEIENFVETMEKKAEDTGREEEHFEHEKLLRQFIKKYEFIDYVCNRMGDNVPARKRNKERFRQWEEFANEHKLKKGELIDLYKEYLENTDVSDNDIQIKLNFWQQHYTLENPLSKEEQKKRSDAGFERGVLLRAFKSKNEIIEERINRLKNVSFEERVEEKFKLWEEFANKNQLNKDELIDLCREYLENTDMSDDEIQTELTQWYQHYKLEIPLSEEEQKNKENTEFQQEILIRGFAREYDSVGRLLKSIESEEKKNSLSNYLWTIFASENNLSKKQFLEIYGMHLKKNGKDDESINEELSKVSDILTFDDPLNKEQIEKLKEEYSANALKSRKEEEHKELIFYCIAKEGEQIDDLNDLRELLYSRLRSLAEGETIYDETTLKSQRKVLDYEKLNKGDVINKSLAAIEDMYDVVCDSLKDRSEINSMLDEASNLSSNNNSSKKM